MKIFYFGELISDTKNQNKTSEQQQDHMTPVGDILRDTSPYRPRQTRRPQHQSQTVRDGLFPAVKFMFGAGSYGGVIR